MYGIVLAAGESSRMPNKMCLPIGKNRIAIESSLDLCERYCEHTYVIFTPDAYQYMVTLLEHKGYSLKRHFHYRTIQDLSGTSWAIRQSVKIIINELKSEFEPQQYLICYCDNIFHINVEPNPLSLLQNESEYEYNYAQVRRVANNNSYKELDRWCDVKHYWLDRSYSEGDIDDWYLLGWLLLTKEACLSSQPDLSTVQFLNQIKARPVKTTLNCYDIGTVAGYIGYINATSPFDNH